MSNLTPQEARQIAAEAYVFAYPMLMCYRALYYAVINEGSPAYRAPFNQMAHDSKPADHTRIDVVTMNGDTPYSNFGIDLRVEQVVVSVPEIKGRYYVIQFPDLYTHNFAFIGTRATGTEAGDYLFVGPKWEGEIPEGKFKQIIYCETELTGGVGRTQLFGLDDLPNVLEIQKGYKIATLSEFMGEEPKATPETDWLPWKEEALSSVEFIDYFNFLIPFCEPIHDDDQEAMARFARIGIAPGAAFDRSAYGAEIVKAIEAGIADGRKKIAHKAENIAEQVNGWNMTDAVGPRAFFKGDWLLRAAAGMAALFMNDKIEAFYPIVYVDADGQVLDGQTGKYILHFEKDEIPPAKYFWSVTMYDKRADGTAGYMIENPINRYLINSTTEGLIYDKDGGLTIYIQHDQPEGDKAANWLPAPAEPFYLAMRIYGPEESVMNNEWAPPPIEKVNQKSITPDEAKAIAKEAYIYGFPMVMNCKTVYDYVVNENSPEYKAPFNQMSCEARVFTPEDKTIITVNSDTPYCMQWMDLRAEPQVISVPEIDAERYYSFQLIDWYTHNFAYIGTRMNNNKSGKYILAGPDWNGDKPEGITEIIKSETNLVFVIVRIQVYDANDMDNVKEIQESFKLQPLSAYLGKEAPASSPKIDFPEWVNGSEFTTTAFEYLDFALDQVDTHPDELEFMERLAKIGIGTSEKFNLSEKDSSFIKALEEGVQEAFAEMKAFTIEAVKDPLGSTKGFGTREFLKEAAAHWNQPNLFLQRAGVAQLGLYGNSGEEAVYIGYFYDKDGKLFDAAENNFFMKFKEGDLPPVNAFWSLSMYDGPTQLFIHNPLNRYLLNSTMKDQFVKEEDGSIVLYIQKDSLGKDRESNWLPAPNGPFYLVNRLYWPKPDVIAGTWTPPPVRKVD